MISVKKNFISQPTGLLTPKCKNQVTLTLNQHNNHKFSSYYYRDKTINTLKSLYHNKCAYCETKSGPGSTLRVDHYRPKDKVIGTSKACKGYYWLGYEWSNLLPACETCNRAKSNHFPLVNESNRIISPIVSTDGKTPIKDYLRADLPTLRSEDPLLLNPEIDQVEDHLIFRPNGSVKPITPYGVKTIEIYNLNRAELIISRKKIIDKTVNKIKILLLDYLVRNSISNDTFNYSLCNIYTGLINKTNASQEYSRLSTLAFLRFDLFIADQLPSQAYKDLILDTFDRFRKKQLCP